MAEKITIDATKAILGRLLSHIAKQALLGKEITVVNIEKAILIGSEQIILAKYKARIARGTNNKGPFFPSTPEQVAKRAVRGMLDYKKARGKEAFKRIKFYAAIPKEFEKTEKIKFENDKQVKDFMTIEKLCDLV